MASIDPLDEAFQTVDSKLEAKYGSEEISQSSVIEFNREINTVMAKAAREHAENQQRSMEAASRLYLSR